MKNEVYAFGKPAGPLKRSVSKPKKRPFDEIYKAKLAEIRNDDEPSPRKISSP